MLDFNNRHLFTPFTHPRFCYNDQYVVFTTTVRGEIDVAIVPTAELVEKTI